MEGVIMWVGLSEQESFESGFEKWERVRVAQVRREGVPELGSRATEGSDPMVTRRADGTESWREEEERREREGVEMRRSASHLHLSAWLYIYPTRDDPRSPPR
ncbi:hypothetical protein WMY93_032039 [Mugilogobius chulae]|uniref:Uncharacterized protein n=1 Tax=Mugilogobius chulae TaxID=88201 RepID=A0AAW0MCQ4_9GOBI